MAEPKRGSEAEKALRSMLEAIDGTGNSDFHLGGLVFKALQEMSPAQRKQSFSWAYRDYPTEAISARFSANSERVEVLAKARELRISRLAKQEVDSDQRAPAPEPILLSDLLAEPDEPVLYRVDRVWPLAGRVVLAAQNKIGKTTLVGNVVRSLVDGVDFLGRYKVAPVERVAVLDDEMSRTQVRQWLKEQGIEQTQRVQVVSLRGSLSSFNILDPAVRAEWAERLAGAEVLVFDCLRPALDSLGLDENLDAGRFLVALDELCREAGIGELLLVHHMGHSNERSRGSSRIDDWPDVKWKLVREDDDERSSRYFSAYGRDVDEPESRLRYDAPTRRLSIDPSGGSRKKVRAEGVTSDVAAYVGDHPGCTKSEAETAMGKRAAETRQAIKLLIEAEAIEVKPGPRNSHRLYLAGPADAFDETSDSDEAGTLI